MRSLLFVLVGSVLLDCAVARTNDAGIKFLLSKRNDPDVTEMTSGLMYKVLRHGDGDHHPGPNTPCSCHYAGTLLDGTLFDSSYDRGAPSTFSPNQVIKGWTEAMEMMVEGDKWELYLPSEIAYGDEGSPPNIGGGEVLIFTIEMIEILGDEKKDKLRCEVWTREKCNEEEIKYIEKIDRWNIHKKKFEIARLRDIMEDNKTSHRFRAELIEWMRRRVHLLKQMVVYQPEEDNPYHKNVALDNVEEQEL